MLQLKKRRISCVSFGHVASVAKAMWSLLEGDSGTKFLDKSILYVNCKLILKNA